MTERTLNLCPRRNGCTDPGDLNLPGLMYDLAPDNGKTDLGLPDIHFRYGQVVSVQDDQISEFAAL